MNALAKALAKDLGPWQACIDDMKLVDFKVRITNGGTEAVTRVIIDSEDGQGRRWSTVGVSANIVDASFEALLEAIQWKLIRDHGRPDAGPGMTMAGLRAGPEGIASRGAIRAGTLSWWSGALSGRAVPA